VREGGTRTRRQGEKSTTFDGKSASSSEDRSGESLLIEIAELKCFWGQSCGLEKSDAEQGKEWKLETRTSERVLRIYCEGIGRRKEKEGDRFAEKVGFWHLARAEEAIVVYIYKVYVESTKWVCWRERAK